MLKRIKNLFYKKEDHDTELEKVNSFRIMRMINGEMVEIANSYSILLISMMLDEKHPIVFSCSLPPKGEYGTLYVIKEDKGLCTKYDIYTWNDDEEKFDHRKTIESYI